MLIPEHRPYRAIGEVVSNMDGSFSQVCEAVRQPRDPLVLVHALVFNHVQHGATGVAVGNMGWAFTRADSVALPQ